MMTMQLEATDPTAVAATIQEWLASSERVLIGAGAGLSVAAGIDYGDKVSFARRGACTSLGRDATGVGSIRCGCNQVNYNSTDCTDYTD
jgi:hypothetical protein